MPSYVPFQHEHLAGVISLCEAEGWPSFPADPDRAQRAITAPGVTTIVALEGEEVVAFACLHSDGEIQAHLSLIAVEPRHRRRGVGRELISVALARAGGERIDLVTDSADEFYKALPHRRMAGFRLYPSFDPKAAPPRVRPVHEDERPWMADELVRLWGARTVVSRGRQHDAATLPAVIAQIGGERLGMATYNIEEDQAELVTIDAFVQGARIGTALLSAVAEVATAAGCSRLWLITTNDNLDALRFYQRRGLRMVAVHRGAVDEARGVKAQIPTRGDFGIPVHDEIELELLLPGRRGS